MLGNRPRSGHCLFRFPISISAPSFLQEYLSHVLLPHGLIVDRVEKIAADILADYPTSTPHLLVVLKVRGGDSSNEYGLDVVGHPNLVLSALRLGCLFPPPRFPGPFSSLILSRHRANVHHCWERPARREAASTGRT